MSLRSSLSDDLAPAPLTAQDVIVLQAVRDHPAVSVLMSTTPAGSLTLTDQTRLEDLLDQAALRLARLRSIPGGDPVLHALRTLAEAAAAAPARHGLALYAARGTARAVQVGLPLVDRVVIDSTFATRDLVLALQRTPRHVVLVLSSQEARLFESVAGQLQPAATTTFPVRADRAPRRDPGRAHLTGADTASFFRDVARRLATYRALHPSPLVLVGPTPQLAAFQQAARGLDRLAGTVTGHHLDTKLEELTAATRPVLQTYLASREQEALDLLQRRTAQGRVAAGMPAAWAASRTEHPEMLAVEQGLFYPAVIGDDGRTLELSADLDAPGFVDDAVDELIEHVLLHGGWVAFVGDRTLRQFDGVALTWR
jgi:hypothetical protein